MKGFLVVELLGDVCTDAGGERAGFRVWARGQVWVAWVIPC